MRQTARDAIERVFASREGYLRNDREGKPPSKEYLIQLAHELRAWLSETETALGNMYPPESADTEET